jgi:sugar O-acyltransferase (sialic acid O-acetyltransferase NeuD family)
LEKIIIHSCGGHARSVANIILLELDYNVVFVDSNAKAGEIILGCPVFKDIKEVDGWMDCAHHIGTGDLAARKLLFGKYKQVGCKFPVIASSSACIASTASIAEGVFIGHGAYVGPNAAIGNNTIINTRAVIEHDVKVGMHSHISVNSTIAGYVEIGNQAFIGAGATLIDKISICDSVTVGAGAVVVTDIVNAGTYVGVPAKAIQKRI